MTDRKAVIKNADMSEDMQQDAGKWANDGCCSSRSLYLSSWRRHPSIGEIQHRKRHRCVHQKGIRQEVQSYLALVSDPIPWKASGISQMCRSALVSSVVISARTWLTKRRISSISTWVRWPFYSSNQVKTMNDDHRSVYLGRLIL